MSTELAAVAQAILDGKWRHAAAARAACRDGSWAAFVARTAPPRPVLLGRFDHAACVERAVAMFSGPREVDFELLPIWVVDNEEEPSAEWVRAHATRVEGEPLARAEPGPLLEDAEPLLDVRVHGRARMWSVGNVAPSRSYAPGIELALRRGELCVVAGLVLDVVSVEATPHPPRARPTLVAPPFCVWVEPRVEGLSDEERREVLALSITVDEEGALIERPAG